MWTVGTVSCGSPRSFASSVIRSRSGTIRSGWRPFSSARASSKRNSVAGGAELRELREQTSLVVLQAHDLGALAFDDLGRRLGDESLVREFGALALELRTSLAELLPLGLDQRSHVRLLLDAQACLRPLEVRERDLRARDGGEVREEGGGTFRPRAVELDRAAEPARSSGPQPADLRHDLLEERELPLRLLVARRVGRSRPRGDDDRLPHAESLPDLLRHERHDRMEQAERPLQHPAEDGG